MMIKAEVGQGQLQVSAWVWPCVHQGGFHGCPQGQLIVGNEDALACLDRFMVDEWLMDCSGSIDQFMVDELIIADK